MVPGSLNAGINMVGIGDREHICQTFYGPPAQGSHTIWRLFYDLKASCL